ncbi:MAG TPA: homoserine O-acetyltransferase [Gemmatimonadaceae bacterium]|nr:homoserine O-acetyltransferase [Gemmatimonadaceae bacterium]
MSPRTPLVHWVPRLVLDGGAVLEDVRQAYHLDGALDAERGNLVLVFHALTGSADAAGDWWREIIGAGKAIDTRRWAVLAPNLLGSCYGTTGPSTWGRGAFPTVTPRDMARLAWQLVDAIGARTVALAVGGSLGGMVAQEFALLAPERVRRTVALAAPAAHTAYAIGWNHVQREAVRLGGAAGLALARMVGMMTFRTEAELGLRFGRAAGEDGRFDVQRYLARHGEKLVARFDAATYVTLLDAMDAHDVGRGRGGVDAALRVLAGRVVGVGIPGDLLYGADEVRRWTAAAGGDYREIESVHGHDAFLIEHEQVGRILREALDAAGRESEDSLCVA